MIINNIIELEQTVLTHSIFITLFTVFKSKKSNFYYEIINLVKRKNKYQDCCSYNLDNKINSCHKWALRLNFKQYYTAFNSFLQSYIDERNFNQRRKT